MILMFTSISLALFNYTWSLCLVSMGIGLLKFILIVGGHCY